MQGREALLPWEIQKVRQYLLSTNTLWGLQMWSMINMQIHLGLREDDLVNLKFEKIFLNLSTLRNGQVDCLFIEFKGKTERKTGTPVRLLLWADNENPVLCPIRSLLAYLYMAQLKTGYLFPQSHLLGSITDATDDSHKMKERFGIDCVSVYEQVTGNVGVYGTHTGINNVKQREKDILFAWSIRRRGDYGIETRSTPSTRL